MNKKCVYMSYFDDELTHSLVDEISENVKTENFEVYRNSIDKNEKTEATKTILESAVAIFFVTNVYAESERCEAEINHIKSINKNKRVYLVLDNFNVYERVEEVVSTDKDAIIVEAYKFFIETKAVNIAKDIFEILKPILNKLTTKNINKTFSFGNINDDTCPERDADFVGDTDKFDEIKRKLDQNKCVALHGLPGIGKRSYALEYCYRSEMKVFWFNCGNKEKLIEALIRYTSIEKLIKNENDFQVIHEKFLDFLKTNTKNILLVFCNVENDHEIKSIKKLIDFQQLGLFTIITTKSNRFNNIDLIKIEPFSPDECERYLLKTACKQDKIREIIRFLKLSNTHISPFRLAQIVATLKNNPDLRIEEHLYKINNENNIFFFTIFEEISFKSKDAFKLLQFVRFLDPDYIIGKILKKLPIIEHLPYVLEILANQNLCKIINSDCKNFGISIHRLVQAEIENYSNVISSNSFDNEKMIIHLIRILNEVFPKLDYMPDDNWTEAENINCHLTNIIEKFNFHKPTNDIIELFSKLSTYNILKVFNCEKYLDYSIKVAQMRRLMHKAENADSFNENVSVSYYNIANTFLEMKQLDKAFEFYNKALEIEKAIRTDDHLNIAKNLFGLGTIFFFLGSIEQSLNYHLDCLKIRQNLQTCDEVDLEKSLNSVFLCYKKLHNYKNALIYGLKSMKIRQNFKYSDEQMVEIFYDIGMCYEKIDNQVMALRYKLKFLKLNKNSHPVDNLQHAKFLHSIGILYFKLGKHRNSLKYNLKVKEMLHDSENLFMAKLLNSISISYMHLRIFEKALDYSLKSLEMKKEIFKGDNSSIAQSLFNTGVIISYLKDEEKALKYKFECLEMRERIFGDCHPAIAQCHQSIASSYNNLKNYDRSLEFTMKSYKIKKKLYKEDDHMQIEKCLNLMSKCYEKLDYFSESLGYKLKCLEMQNRLYKGYHTNIAQTFYDLGRLYSNTSKQNALKYYLLALEMKERIYKDNHPKKELRHPVIADCLYNIGKCFSELDENEKAIEYKLRSLNMRSILYKRPHPIIAQSLFSVAVTYSKLGDFKKSLEYDLKCLEMRQNLNQKDNPEIANSLHGVGVSYSNLENHTLALDYKIKALGMRQRLFNENHPSILQSLQSIAVSYKKLNQNEKYLFFINKLNELKNSVEERN